MNTQVNIKIKLFELCTEYVEQKIKNAQQAIDNAQASANQETKSSSGDKYETGRSMMQLEIEKYVSQLTDGFNLKKILTQIDCTKSYQIAQPGALVYTNNGFFFISISTGKLIFEDVEYLAISLSSPIGQILFNKKTGDDFIFRNKKFIVKDII